MTTVPEEAVFAAAKAITGPLRDPTEWELTQFRLALTAALPHLPGVGVKKLAWNEYEDEQGNPDRWDAEAASFGVFYSIEIQHDGYRVVFDHEAVGSMGVFDNLEAAKAAAQADYEARILSALEPSACKTCIGHGIIGGMYRVGDGDVDAWDEPCPECLGEGHHVNKIARAISIWATTCGIETVEGPDILEGYLVAALATEPSAARDLALEEAAVIALSNYMQADEDGIMVLVSRQAIEECLPTLRALSSPAHADAGKVEGDGGANLERYWRPISEADKSITFEQTYDLGDGKSMTIRNSDHYWVRDANGRVYEATWSDHKDGYWWDLEGESPVDPVEYMPHPLSLPSAPSQEVAGS